MAHSASAIADVPPSRKASPMVSKEAVSMSRLGMKASVLAV
jgi:hypothetical protein